MLRTLGRGQLPGTEDPFELTRLFEAWASHLAIGAPHPDDLRPDDDDGQPTVLRRERDWPGAQRFVQTRRDAECAQITKTVAQSHELLWELSDRMVKSLLDARRRDSEVLEQMERLRAAIATGSLDVLAQEVSNVASVLTDAIQQREQDLKVQVEELGNKVVSLSEQLQEVRVESSLDGLTRIHNRASFDRAIKRWHHVGTTFNRPTLLVLIDVDNLKQINDRYGHRGGDAALRVFANCLVRAFPRRSDFVGRYGGDELVVLLAETPGRIGLSLVERFLERIRTTPAEHDGVTISLTASVGLAQLEGEESIESWLERADRALYDAKQAGRDRVMFARPPD